MSKSASPRPVATNQAMAVLRGVKGSVQKAELVLGLIRGKKVEQALNDLTFCTKRMAEPLRKTLVSAIANAEANHSLNVDRLVVTTAYAGKLNVLKRFHARARGRGAKILKPTCQLTVIVSEQAPVVKAAKVAKPAKTTEAKAVKAPAKPVAEKTNETTEA